MAADEEGKADVILDVAVAAQRQRDALLETFRARAGWTLASASIAAAVLAPGAGNRLVVVLASLVFALMTAAVVSAYWPRDWTDTPNVTQLVANYLDAEDADELSTPDIKRDVALLRYQLFEQHEVPLCQVRRSMNASMVLLGAFVVLLLLDRTV